MISRMKILVPLLAAVPLVVYLGFALGGMSFTTVINLVLAISIGIAGLIGTIEIYRELASTQEGTTLTTGTIFLLIAFSFFVLMVVVQQATFLALRDLANSNPSEHHQALALGLNYIQLGIDVTFDVFYSLGIGLVSWVMMRMPGITAWIGVYGILSGVFLLGLNLATFPVPPSSAGLFDAGPFTALWWLSFIVAGAIEKARRKDPAGQ